MNATSRLKDLVSIEGIRENQLVGYGIVVGLAKTGDKQTTIFSAQSLANILERMGVSVSPTAIRVTNTAAVMVTGTLPPFAQPGTKIDVTAAAIGDATNLQGGLLLMTSMHGANGQVYAVAQGPVVTGGFVAGRGGNTQTVNHPTVGRLPGGATVG
jgi:flagellar P-ring protein precursor FlgI